MKEVSKHFMTSVKIRVISHNQDACIVRKRESPVLVTSKLPLLSWLFIVKTRLNCIDLCPVISQDYIGLQCWHTISCDFHFQCELELGIEPGLGFSQHYMGKLWPRVESIFPFCSNKIMRPLKLAFLLWQ